MQKLKKRLRIGLNGFLKSCAKYILGEINSFNNNENAKKFFCVGKMREKKEKIQEFPYFKPFLPFGRKWEKSLLVFSFFSIYSRF